MKMPSAEETTYLIEVMPDSGLSQDSYGSRDVDVLVSRIKENLRLSSLKSRSSLAHKIRPKPYSLHSTARSWSESSICELCTARSNSVSEPTEQQLQQGHHHLKHSQQCRRNRRIRMRQLDDYERFKALLKQGALIKEAVKRLQTDDDDAIPDSEEDDGRRASTSATSTTLDSMDDEEEDEDERDATTRHAGCTFFYRRKHFDYDSDDESYPDAFLE